MKEKLGKNAVLHIAQLLSLSTTGFARELFIKDALSGLDDLELKQRVNHLINVLAIYLPDEFEQAAEVLKKLKKNWYDEELEENSFSFAAWPLIDYVAEYGLQQPELALSVLKILTPLFSAEFAVRPFIEQHFDYTHQQLIMWTEDKDEHVRRLASEGSRPRLPWGKRLNQFCDDPKDIFPILEKLKDDPSLYVRRSVANNLNDITKDHPEKVINLCQKWYKNASQERVWLIRHGLRSLVKAGHPAVFPLLGYTEEPELNLVSLDTSKTKVTLGENLGLSVDLLSTSTQTQKIVIDYKIHHVKASGKMSEKVFKWKNATIQPKQQLSLEKKHSFKPISTRNYYSGNHYIELLINGQSYGKKEFELVVE